MTDVAGDHVSKSQESTGGDFGAPYWYARQGHELLGCRPPWTSPLCEIGSLVISREPTVLPRLPILQCVMRVARHTRIWIDG